MPLNRLAQEASFAGGLNQKADPKQLPPQQLIVARNVVQQKDGRVEKRHGYVHSDNLEGVDPAIETQRSLDPAWALYTRGDELFAHGDMAGPRFVSRAKRCGWRWADSVLSPMSWRFTDVSEGAENVSGARLAVVNGFAVLLHIATEGTKVFAVDASNNVVAAEHAAAGLFVVNGGPQSNRAILVNESANEIDFFDFVLDDPTEISAPQAATYLNSIETLEDVATDKVSACETPTGFAIAWIDDVISEIRVRHYTWNSVSQTYTAASYGPTAMGANQFSVVHIEHVTDGNSDFLVVVYRHDTNPYTLSYFVLTIASATSLTLNSSAEQHSIEAGTPNGLSDFYGSISVIESEGDIRIFWGLLISGDTYPSVRTQLVTYTGGTTGASFEWHRASIGSQAFSLNSQIHLWMRFLSATQQAYMLVTDSTYKTSQRWDTVGRALYRSASDTGVSDARASGDSIFFSLFAAVIEGAIGQTRNIAKLVNANVSLRKLPSADIATTKLLGGPCCSLWDGRLQETNFFLNPQIEFDQESATGSLDLLGVYSYRCVFEYTDRNGEKHRSSPSVALVHTLTGANNAIRLYVYGIQFGRYAKMAKTTAVLYRTTNGGNIYYRVEPSSGDWVIDPTTERLQVVDGEADSAITSREVLYTQGGELDNASPPAPKALTATKDRVWLVPHEDPTALYASKPKRAGLPVEFAETLFSKHDAGGPIEALAPLDDNIVIFKRDSIYLLQPTAPNALGAGRFEQARFLTSDVGCDNGRSVAVMPQGVMFQARKTGSGGRHKGIHLLARDLQTQYVGAPVENHNGATVIDATLARDTQHVRFLLDSGVALVYDYQHRAWYEWTEHDYVSAVSWLGDYALLRSDGYLAVQSPSAYTELANEQTDLTKVSAVEMQAGPGWFRTTGLAGFQRLWWLVLLGEWKSVHTLHVDMYYDYSDSVAETVSFSRSDADAQYLLRIKPSQQKCTAFRFVARDESSIADGASGEGFTLSAMRLIYGSRYKTITKAGNTGGDT